MRLYYDSYLCICVPSKHKLVDLYLNHNFYFFKLADLLHNLSLYLLVYTWLKNHCGTGLYVQHMMSENSFPGITGFIQVIVLRGG